MVPVIQHSNDKFLELSASFQLERANSVDTTDVVGQRVLYIHEGEVAINIPEGSFDIIGCDDATTCHIFFAKSRDTTVCRPMICSHIDSVDSCTSLFDIIASNHSLTSTILDIYIIGGINDEMSLEISIALLNLMRESSNICVLQLFFTCSINSYFKDKDKDKLGLSFPINMGCAFKDMMIKPYHFIKPLREPEYLLRRCISLTTSGTLTLVYNGAKSASMFNISRFSLGNVNLDMISSLLSCPQSEDEIILKAISTSPHCEPGHFVQEMRETLRTVLLGEDYLSHCFFGTGDGSTSKGNSNSNGYSHLEYEINELGTWQKTK